MKNSSYRISPGSLMLLIWCPLSYTQSPIWQQINGPVGVIANVLISDSSGILYLGTYGNGIYRSTDEGDH